MHKLFALLALLCLSFAAHAVDFSPTPDPSIYAPYAGQWFNPETGGQGFFLEVSTAGAMFAWYTYPISGEGQMWFVTSMADSTVKSFDHLFLVAHPLGGKLNTPSNTVLAQEFSGQLSFEPVDCDHAVITVNLVDDSIGCDYFSPRLLVCEQAIPVVRLTKVGTCPAE